MRNRRILLMTAVTVLALVLGAIPALATGKGSGKAPAKVDKGGSVVIADADPTFGEQVTFTIAVSADMPWVTASCYQDGQRVYRQTHGFFDSYRYGQWFTLGPTPSWSSGDADCTAEVGYYAKNGRWKSLASTTFQVVDEGGVVSPWVVPASTDEEAQPSDTPATDDVAADSPVAWTSFGGSLIYPI